MQVQERTQTSGINIQFMRATRNVLKALENEFSIGVGDYVASIFETMGAIETVGETWQKKRIIAITPKMNALLKVYEEQYDSFFSQLTQYYNSQVLSRLSNEGVSLKAARLISELTQDYNSQELSKLIEEVVSLGKAARLFSERICTETTLSTKIQNTLEAVSCIILKLYDVPLYDHQQQLLLSIPYYTYIKFVPPEGNGKYALDELIALTQRCKGKDLYPVIPITKDDYEVGLKWVEDKCLIAEQINSLIRVASIFKNWELAVKIDLLAEKYIYFLVDKRPNLEEFYRQVQFSYEYHLRNLRMLCRMQFVSSLQQPGIEKELEQLITSIGLQQTDFLFGKKGIIPHANIASTEGDAAEKIHFGKLFCLSKEIRNLIRDVESSWDGCTPLPLTLPLPPGSQKLLTLFVNILSEGGTGNKITKENCVDLFALADAWGFNSFS